MLKLTSPTTNLSIFGVILSLIGQPFYFGAQPQFSGTSPILMGIKGRWFDYKYIFSVWGPGFWDIGPKVSLQAIAKTFRRRESMIQPTLFVRL